MDSRAALVLVIDDDPLYLDPLRDLLEAQDILADYATTWEQGLEAFRIGQHELVVADYNLPGSEHVLQLLSRIKELNPSTRLVLISGKFGPERRVDVEKVVDRFLEKVGDLDEIVREVQDAANRASAAMDWPEIAASYRDPSSPGEDSLRDIDERLRRSVTEDQQK